MTTNKFYCNKCGNIVDKDKTTCPHCGNNLLEESEKKFEVDGFIYKENIQTDTKTHHSVSLNPSKITIFIAICIVTLISTIVLTLFYNMPINQVKRELNNNKISEAYQIYNDNISQFSNTNGIKTLIYSHINMTVTDFKNEEITYDEATQRLSLLGKFTPALQYSQEQFNNIEGINESRQYFAQGLQYYKDCKYYDAVKNLQLVTDEKNKSQADKILPYCIEQLVKETKIEAINNAMILDYTKAIQVLKLSIQLLPDNEELKTLVSKYETILKTENVPEILANADNSIQEKQYLNAYQYLEKEYNKVKDSAIRNKMQDIYKLYSDDIIYRVNMFADSEKNDSAVQLINDSLKVFPKEQRFINIKNKIENSASYTINQIGNTNLNISNLGLCASQNDVIYYSNNGLYKTLFDSTDSVKLSNDICKNIVVVGEWIYYYTYINEENAVCKVKTDGSERSIFNNIKSDKFFVVKDKIYFVNLLDKNRLYSIDTSGYNKEKLSDISIDSLSISDNGSMIFFTNSKLYSNTVSLYSIDLSNNQVTTYYDLEYSSATWNGYNIIYTTTDNKLSVYSLVDKSEEFIDENVEYFNVVGNYIIYKNNEGMIRYDKSTKEKKILLNNVDDITYINIVGDRIYFISSQFKTYYVDINGQNFTTVK